MNTIVSISGGRTSAYMAIKMKELAEKSVGGKLHFVFANTSSEHQKTYEFLQRIDEKYSLGIQLVEAVINPTKGVGTGFRVASGYDDLKKNNELYEEFIAKYGIPNVAFPACTRELKAVPLRKYARLFFGEDYQYAIGIRADEEKRRSAKAEKDKLIYPMLDMFKTDKQDIEVFFDSHDFDLEIPNYLGNCVFCFKKGFNRLAKAHDAAPEYFGFTNRMEEIHGQTNNAEGHSARVFFRGNNSTKNMIANFKEFSNTNQRLLDCENGCEAF